MRQYRYGCLWWMLGILGSLPALAQNITQLATAGQLAAGDRFACAVSISGDTVVAGNYLDDDRGVDSGSALFFRRSGSAWSSGMKVVPPSLVPGDHFGFTVAIDGDWAAVAAPQAEDGRGAVYVYRRQSASWTEEARLVAPSRQAGDQFGASLALRGSTLIIGTPGANPAASNNAGEVHIFQRSGTWLHRQRLTAPDGIAGAEFGRAVAAAPAPDGSVTIAIGAPRDSDGATFSGSVYLFRPASSGSSWQHDAKLTSPDGGSLAEFGRAVSLTTHRLAVGAPFSDQLGGNAGAVYIFERTTIWDQGLRLAPGPAISPGDLFGASVDIDTDRLIAGAPTNFSTGTTRPGAFYDFARNPAGTWALTSRRPSPQAEAGDGFGIDLEIDGSSLVVGSYLEDSSGEDSGAAYVTDLGGGSTGADLEIDSSTSLNVVVPGVVDGMIYSVTVTNRGPQPLDSAQLNFDFPTSVPSGRWQCVNPPSGVVCRINPSMGISDTITGLAAGQSVSYQVTATVAADATDPVVVSASLSASSPVDSESANNTADLTFDLAPLPPIVDLALSLTCPATVTPGLDATFKARVTNLGPSPISGVTMPSTIGTPLSCAAILGAGCAVIGPTALVSLEVNGSVEVDYVVPLASSTMASPTFSVEATPPATTMQLPPGNNSASCIPDLLVKTSLAVTSSPQPQADPADPADPGDPGDPGFFVVKLNNRGPSDAFALPVDIETPEGFECTHPLLNSCEVLAVATPGGGRQTIRALADVPAAPADQPQEVSIAIRGSLPTDVCGASTVSAEIDLPDGVQDSSLEDNETVTEIDLKPLAELEVTIADSQLSSGRELTHTVTLSNPGPCALDPANLEFQLPPELQLLSASCLSGCSEPLGDALSVELPAGTQVAIQAVTEAACDAEGNLDFEVHVTTPDEQVLLSAESKATALNQSLATSVSRASTVYASLTGPPKIFTGQIIELVLTLRNQKPYRQSDLELRLPRPDELEFSQVILEQEPEISSLEFEESGVEIRWLGVLDAGAEVIFGIQAKAAVRAPAEVRLQGEFWFDSDGFAGNDASGETDGSGLLPCVSPFEPLLIEISHVTPEIPALTPVGGVLLAILLILVASRRLHQQGHGDER